MPRTARATVAGYCYHVINRANNRAQIFHDYSDYAAFIGLIAAAQQRHAVAMLAACLMPNHVHLVLQPADDKSVTRWMHWLFTSHVSRHHRKYGTNGRLWQGRFKASAIQQDLHLLRVMRYVERNALRAGIVGRAENWEWGSLNWRSRNHPLVAPHSPPVALPVDWVAQVNEPQNEAELEDLRASINRQKPIGTDEWIELTARTLGVPNKIRPRGRPRKEASSERAPESMDLWPADK